MLEVAGITIAVVGACALALWLMLRSGSVAHRAREADLDERPGPTAGADEAGGTPPSG